MKRLQKIEKFSVLLESLVSDQVDVFVMFADLCNSTQYKRLCEEKGSPDYLWVSRQLIFLQRAAKLVKEFHGSVVKTIGDELMVIFPSSISSDKVLECGFKILSSYENLRSYQNESEIEVKVSIDFGPTYNGTVITDIIYDPIGKCVDRCARLNNEASVNQVVISEDFYNIVEKLLNSKKFKKKFLCKEESSKLKGFGQTRFYRLIAKK
jgi:class 3 adenylate cyclase